MKESLVFDKHTGALIGFTDLGDTNNYIAKLERATSEKMEPLAKSLLVLMVRGLFSPFQFPYAQFACSSLTGDQLHSIFWDAVRRLERYHFIIHNTHTPVEDIIRLQDRHQSTMCNLRRLLCEPTVPEATRERQWNHTQNAQSSCS